MLLTSQPRFTNREFKKQQANIIKIKSPLHVFTQKIENSLGSCAIAVKAVLFLHSQGSPPCILDYTLARDKAGNCIHIVSARGSREKTLPLPGWPIAVSVMVILY